MTIPRRRASIALVALTVLVGATAVTATAATPADGADQTQNPVLQYEVANYTLIGHDATPREAAHTQSLDVSTALAMDRDAAVVAHQEYALEDRLEQADNPDDRDAILLGTSSRLVEDAEGITTAHQAAITAYHAGELTTSEFVATLARLTARADHLEQRATHLGLLAQGSQHQGVIMNRLDRTRGFTAGLHTPLRHDTRDAITGTGQPTLVTVSVTPDVVVLATVHDRTFVREAYRPGDRAYGDPHNPDFDFEDALDAFRVAYPAVSDRFLSKRLEYPSGIAANYILIGATVPEGEVIVTIDGSTERFFGERFRWHVDRIDPGPAHTVEDNGVVIDVHHTFDTGPLLVVTTDNETGDPLPTTIQLNETTPVETGDDGAAWLVAPTPPYNITVAGAHGETTLTIDRDALDP